MCGGTCGYRSHRQKCQRVYPRVCGGTSAGSLSPTDRSGLSPCVRGNPTLQDSVPAVWRSIPACAGEPVSHSAGGNPLWVYPRVCGGTVYERKHAINGVGLSPRVRGNHPSSARPQRRSRSIPACAGEPTSVMSASAI